VRVVQPIRDKAKIEELKAVLMQQHIRNYFLLVLGINTGLRISDLLQIQVYQVRGRSHLELIEKKTGKNKRFRINAELQRHINEYTAGMDDNAYLFKSRRGTQPIQRVQAYKILNYAAREVGLREIGTHTLRKTFGYHFYQKYKDVAILQQIFNHSSPSVTLRYIGINQDIMDEAIDGFSL
jgi:integrase